MDIKVVSAVEWLKKEGKWFCSLICYDGVFSQIWLKPGTDFSFKIQPGRYCVGYTVVSSGASNTKVSLKSLKAMIPCPSTAKIKKGNKCLQCYRRDLVHPCLICDGTKCGAEPSLQRICEQATAYVYLASFGSNQIKVGVAHNTRIAKRWIEQGANLAKRVIVGNGIEARKFEKAIHKALNVLSGLKTSSKVDTLWKRPKTKEFHALSRKEDEITRRFPEFPFYHDHLHDLSAIYSLPVLDRRPVELNFKKNLQISGEILGAKGSLLLLEIGNLPHFVNLKHLLGKRIELAEPNVKEMQTSLDRF